MIESKAFSSGSDDSSSGALSESKCSNSHLLWGINESVIISNGGNNNGDLVSKINTKGMMKNANKMSTYCPLRS